MPISEKEMKQCRARSDRAVAVIRLYKVTGGNDDHETALVDLLTDIFHWCDQSGIDPNSIGRTARAHFNAEKHGEEGVNNAS